MLTKWSLNTHTQIVVDKFFGLLLFAYNRN